MNGISQRLPVAARHVHRALLWAFIHQGALPTAEELAADAGIALTDLPAQLRTLAAGDYLAIDAAGRATCLYPFSPTPTPHSVILAGARRHAMCSIDALGIPAMLGQTLQVEGHCAVCNAPITLTVRPGAIETVSPPAAMVAARRDEDEPAFAACCPFTVFVCGPDHATAFARQVKGVAVLSPTSALARAEEIFAGLLAEDLPSSRPRGRTWAGDYAAAPELILFTQNGCAESERVRSWLIDHGVAFAERNTSRDQNAADALIATGTFATPLLVAGQERLLGFQPAMLATLIERLEGRRRSLP